MHASNNLKQFIQPTIGLFMLSTDCGSEPQRQAISYIKQLTTFKG